jgi:hypothetical protein
MLADTDFGSSFLQSSLFQHRRESQNQMGVLHVQQIKAHLAGLFNGLIDMSDCSRKKTEERESTFLTRSLAAFALLHASDLDPKVAALAVTDGGQDNGIDAIHYDDKENIIYII